MNGKYVFKNGLPECTKKILERKTKYIFDQLQHSLAHVTPFAHGELSIMKETVQSIMLNAIRHRVTAFSIEQDYHSHNHVDLDMYYTLATVVAPEGVSVKDIIYFFIFPT